MPNEMASALNKACQMFLYPIAKFLLAHGMKFNEFVEVARLAFVQAAADSEDSVSAIASATGITRKDVARLKDQPRLDANTLAGEISSTATVLTRWFQDKHFLDNKGAPKQINLTEFSDLVKRVNPTLEPRLVQKELVDTQAVEILGNGMLCPARRYYIPDRGSPVHLLRYGLRMRDLAFTLFRNSVAEPGVLLEAASYNLYVETSNRPAVLRAARSHGSSMLSSFDDWLVEQSDIKTTKPIRAGLGVYYFEETTSFT